MAKKSKKRTKGLANNPWLQLGGSALNGLQQQQAIDEANRLNVDQHQLGMDTLANNRGMVNALQGNQQTTMEQNAQESLGVLTGGANRMLGQQAANAADLQGRFTGLQGGINTGTGRHIGGLNQGFAGQEASINQGFQARTDQVLAALEGGGAQERKDINTRFDSSAGADAQSLRKRGLGGTTVASGLSQANQRTRSDALGGLDERLRQQRMDAIAGLTGDQLTAQANMSGQRLGMQERGGNQMLGTAERLGMNDLTLRDTNQQRFAGMDMGFNNAMIGMLGGQASDRYNNSANKIQNQLGMTDREIAMSQDLQFAGPPPMGFQQGGGFGQASVGATSGPTPDWTGQGSQAAATTAMLLMSSGRWKSNVEPIEDALSKVESMRGVEYDWDKEHGGHHDVGFIAEEMQDVVPEIVAEDAAGQVVGMDYGKVTPLLVEAIKELSRKNNELEARLSEIGSRAAITV